MRKKIFILLFFFIATSLIRPTRVAAEIICEAYATGNGNNVIFTGFGLSLNTKYTIFYSDPNDFTGGGRRLDVNTGVSTNEKGEFVSKDVDIGGQTSPQYFALKTEAGEAVCRFNRASSSNGIYCTAERISSTEFILRAAGLDDKKSYTLWLPEDKRSMPIDKSNNGLVKTNITINEDEQKAPQLFALRESGNKDAPLVCRLSPYIPPIACFATFVKKIDEKTGQAKFFGGGEGLQLNTTYQVYRLGSKVAGGDVTTNVDKNFSIALPIEYAKAQAFSLNKDGKQICTFSQAGAPLEPPKVFKPETCEKNTGIQTGLGCLLTSPAGLIGSIFGIVLGIAGGIALLLIIYSGYRMITAAGNPEALQGARETLTSAIVGLLFIIFSFVILEIVGVDILRIPQFGRSGRFFTTPKGDKAPVECTSANFALNNIKECGSAAVKSACRIQESSIIDFMEQGIPVSSKDKDLLARCIQGKFIVSNWFVTQNGEIVPERCARDAKYALDNDLLCKDAVIQACRKFRGSVEEENTFTTEQQEILTQCKEKGG